MTATEYLHAPRPVGPIMPAMERAARGEASPPRSLCGGPGSTALRSADATCPQCLDQLDAEQARDDDREPPPDPADYCEQCGKPLTRCRAWNEGDHTEADLL